MIRRLIGFILSTIVAVVLFVVLLNILPIQTKSIEKVELTYIFIDSDGTEYNIFDQTHGAAKDRSFLFKNNEEQVGVENTGVELSGENNQINNTGEKNNILGNIDYIGDVNSGNMIETGDNQDLSNFNSENPFNLPTGAIEQPISGNNLSGIYLPSGAIEKPIYKDCETPWGISVRHNESILAYQQRKDSPDICNVQRRTCNNGILDGNFVQPSCNENVVYKYNTSLNTSKENSNVVVYTKPEIVSHSKDVSQNELIQNPKYAKNELAEFDKNGKINPGNQNPSTDWDNRDKSGMIGDYDSKEQVNIKNYNCQSPWGEVVQHGQFVRAYEFPFGFTNASCKIELRLCVDGELKGSYDYKDCQYLDITYEEYNNKLEANQNIGNTIQHEITNDEELSGFWGWVKNLFR